MIGAAVGGPLGEAAALLDAEVAAAAPRGRMERRP